jgi:hypothetical protein
VVAVLGWTDREVLSLNALVHYRARRSQRQPSNVGLAANSWELTAGRVRKIEPGFGLGACCRLATARLRMGR